MKRKSVLLGMRRFPDSLVPDEGLLDGGWETGPAVNLRGPFSTTREHTATGLDDDSTLGVEIVDDCACSTLSDRAVDPHGHRERGRIMKLASLWWTAMILEIFTIRAQSVNDPSLAGPGLSKFSTIASLAGCQSESLVLELRALRFQFALVNTVLKSRVQLSGL